MTGEEKDSCIGQPSYTWSGYDILRRRFLFVLRTGGEESCWRRADGGLCTSLSDPVSLQNQPMFAEKYLLPAICRYEYQRTRRVGRRIVI